MQAQTYPRQLAYDPYSFYAERAKRNALAIRKWLAMALAIVGLSTAMAGGVLASAHQLIHGDHLRKEFAVTARNLGHMGTAHDAFAHAMQVTEQARKLTSEPSVKTIYQESPRSKLALAAARSAVEIDDKGVMREIVETPAQDPQAIALATPGDGSSTPASAKRVAGFIGQVAVGDGLVLHVFQREDGSVRYVAKNQQR